MGYEKEREEGKEKKKKNWFRESGVALRF